MKEDHNSIYKTLAVLITIEIYFNLTEIMWPDSLRYTI